jgi:hypothetical protein
MTGDRYLATQARNGVGFSESPKETSDKLATDSLPIN